MDEQNPQPQFYSLEPAVEPQVPWWRKRKLLVIVGAGGAVVVLVIFMVLFAVNFWTNSKASGERELLLEQARQMAEQAAAKCDEGDSACVENAQTDAARSVGDTAACEGLSGDALISCVTLIAIDKKDPSVCGALSGDNKTACSDSANLRLALDGKDYLKCDTIEGTLAHTACQAEIRSAAVAANDCAGYHVEQVACDNQILLQAVVDKGDPAGCTTLPEDLIGTCQDLFTSLDADMDGLNLAEEFGYGTDPKNKDTDGDGYTDGEEIESGHDPLTK